MPPIDHRIHAGLSLRAAEAGEADAASNTVRGVAAVYQRATTIAGLFTEEIAAGAFADSLATFDQRALYQHDDARPLGRRSAGTLRIEDADTGLNVEIDLPASATDVREAIARGDVDGMSIGFRVISDEWTEDDDGKLPHRRILRADLVEVSPVTFPAYTETSIALRDQDAAEARAALEAFRAARPAPAGPSAEVLATRNHIARRLLLARAI